jgi:hypothetical protein
VIVGLAALTGVAGSISYTNAQPGGRRAEIQELLDRRAEAVMARDRAAFMSTVAGDSIEFVQRQRQLFDWMRGVPLESYRLVANWERYGDLARPSDVERYRDADAVVIPVTEERYRISGYDPQPAVEDMFYTFVQREGRWLIGEDTDVDDLTLYTARHLWDFDRVRKLSSEHFLLLQHPCVPEIPCPSVGEDLLSLAEQALERVGRYWKVPWQRKVVLLVPGSEEELRRMIQATFELDDFVAFAYSTVDRDHGIDYTGHRIILNPDNFIGRPSFSSLEILAHELLHIATRRRSGPFVPLFVEEGIADYVGNDADPDALAFFNSDISGGQFSGHLPEDFEFTIGSGEDIFRSYQSSQSAVRFFVERFGLGDLVRFYKRLGRVEVAAGTPRYHVDRALRDVIGLSYDRFQSEWSDLHR